jgi:hypothetical protein
MVDVRWKVQGSAYSTPPDAEIIGAGSYTVGGEFAVQQRMEAELQVADEPPAPFDSGLVVGGGGFPAEIDIEISKNGKVCFDTARGCSWRIGQSQGAKQTSSWTPIRSPSRRSSPTRWSRAAPSNEGRSSTCHSSRW